MIAPSVHQGPSPCAIDEARAAAQRGWPVFALPAARKVPFKGSHAYRDATTDLNRIDAWNHDHPGCNFAVATGTEVNVIEVDFRRGGAATLRELADSYGLMPDTAEAVSPSGGPHIYFVGGAMKGRKDGALGPGIEFMASGQYVLLPGSRSRGGQVYRWRRHPDQFPLASLPPWIVELTQPDVSEKAECHLSDFSAFSETSVDVVIQQTLPEGDGQRNNKILSLGRGLKFDCGLASADVGTLKQIVRRWHVAALPFITTKSFDETWADFLHAFARAKHPLNVNLVTVAASMVDPHDLPEAAFNYDSESARQLVALCSALATVNRNKGNFFLSSHDVATRLNVPQMTAWRMLRMLEADGVIQRVKTGDERRATRYRWRGVP